MIFLKEFTKLKINFLILNLYLGEKRWNNMKLNKLVEINTRANPRGLRDCRQVSLRQNFLLFFCCVLSRPRVRSWCHYQRSQLRVCAATKFAIRDRKTFKVPAQLFCNPILFAICTSKVKLAPLVAVLTVQFVPHRKHTPSP
jgi:hypothetical protein